MAKLTSFGLYLLATLLFMPGVNQTLTNTAAENITRAAETKQTNKEDIVDLAMVMRAMEDGFAQSAREVRDIKAAVKSLEEGIKSSKEEMASLKEGLKSLEEKLNVSSSREEGQTPSTGDLDPIRSDMQSVPEMSLAAEERLKAEIGNAVDTFTSSIIGQKMDNATSCPTESDLKPPAIPSENCYDIQQRGHNTSAVYSVAISGKQVQVYCDMVSDGGGWTVVQRRDDIEPHLDFDLGWADYKRGFGDLNGEFWLGLDTIHGLTSDPFTPMSLRIDLEDWKGQKRVALYHTFMVENEKKKYKLVVGGYGKGPGGGDPGDSLAYHNGLAFSTKDRDNDGWSDGNCAERYKGAWWYWGYHSSNLNGEYLKGETDLAHRGVYWYSWKKSHFYSLKRAAMKIRPR